MIEKMYFESEQDKQYRYELERGEASNGIGNIKRQRCRF